MDEQQLNDFRKYCEEFIEDFDYRLERAWSIVSKMRCPFCMADTDLYGEVESRFEDFCLDNDLNMDDYDLEEIFEEL